MATSVGTLTVDLVAKTASFDGPLENSANKAKKSSKDIQDSFNKMDFGDARGGLMLIDELLGVHIPRHATAFASQIPGLMQAAAAAVPVAAIAAIGIGLIDAADKMQEKQDELRNKAIQVATAWEESGLRIRGEIDAQSAKVIAFNQGPMAAFEFAFEHSASVAIGHLKDIQTQLGVTMKQLTDDTQKWLMVGLGDKPSRDLENFNTQLSSVMVTAESASAGDKFAAIRAGLDLATKKAAELQTKMDGIVKPSAMAGGMAMAAWQSQVQQTQAEADAIDHVIRNLLALSNLQSSTDEGKKTEGKQVAFNETQKGAGLDLSTRLADIAQFKSAAVLAFTELGMRIDQAKSKADGMFSGQELQAHLDYFSRLEKAGGSFEEKLKLAADKKIFLDKEMTTASDQLAAALSRNTEMVSALDETNFKQSRSMNDETMKDVMGIATAKTRAMMVAINLVRGETDEEAKAAAMQQVHAFQRINDTKTEIQQLELLRAAAVKKGQDTLAYDAAIANAQHKRMQDLANELIATGKLGNVFKGTMIQMAEEGRQWQQSLGNTFKQTVAGMNSSIAAFVVTGQGGFRQLAVGAIEEIVKIGLQWVESKLLMIAFGKVAGASEIMTQAAIAGAGGTASMAAAPFPIDLTAPAFGVSMMAEALSYMGLLSASRGADLPNYDTLIHAHPREMVLPAHISDFIRTAASSASGNGGGGSSMSIHAPFQPVIHAMDAAGVDRVLTKHRDVFVRHLRTIVRMSNN